jgi:hypothetical protein
MARISRRDFTYVAAGLGIISAQSFARTAPEPHSFAIQTVRFPNSEAAQAYRPANPNAVVLEAIIAPHVPEYLILTPTERSPERFKDTFVASQTWSGVEADASSGTRVYEFRRYKKPLNRNRSGAPLSSELLERHGIQSVLHRPLAGRHAYLIGFDSLEARARAWEAIAADDADTVGLSYEVSFYRRLMFQ